MATLKLGESCNLLKYGNQVYKISASGLVSTNFPAAIQDSSSDLKYLISANILFKYSAASNSYSQLATLASHTTYSIYTWLNQIVAWGASSTSSGSKFIVNQTIYAILDNSGSANIFYQQNILAN